MKFEIAVNYSTKRTFEIPEGATDEEYDAMKEIIIASIQAEPLSAADIKVTRIDVPAEPRPTYEINKDCD
jgi:hypothetical protein